MKRQVKERLTVVDLSAGGPSPDFARDVRAGLSDRPKHLSPMFFYDEAGSRLFEDITRAPEYYISRVERSILERYADELAGLLASSSTIVELGSGSSAKTRVILRALLARRPFLRYVAVDISRAALLEAAPALLEEFPGLSMTAVVGDYAAALAWLSTQRTGPRKAVLYLGSSMGNFPPEQARELMGLIAAGLDEGDRLVLGADLRKPASVVERAYNDAGGVTARFNLNLLRRINDELGGRFDPAAFRHLAFYNERAGRIEMHLESRREQDVPVNALREAFHFDRGETIHTEDSYKYDLAQLDALASGAGLRRARLWLDERRWFSVNAFQR